ncbi:MAG: CAF17-like 4Fe-4S cluster assembly/insertion protein YgfZ [Sagittula sp.]|jgi:tRNA-modifying protein YgfZ|uniref:CAF17-like 4Fe-4S cluster assembly/insertion protein YgfZ n=1 Tax=unclassified Sagittula TaxID=2624628 RepID=UPI0024C2722A|nr:folate-binding protein [Sagittula sp. MA-2]WHZ34108.1 folate-binding protein [Sagittula sp. MA-2]
MTQESRTVLRVHGAKAREFLQGLVTNDVERLDEGLVYAALLTPQGKYRADFFLVPDGEDVLIDVEVALAVSLMQALSMYKLRTPVEITETDLVVTRGTGTPPEGAFADPRDPRLGWRGYAGQPAGEADWDALRVAACVPRAGVELTPDTFILEAGFERLNGVDFKKGCYVGQEVTARMKHKTELRKGLARVAIDGHAPVGTTIVSNGKEAGTLFTQAGNEAIAYLRFDRAGEDMMAGDVHVSMVG